MKSCLLWTWFSVFFFCVSPPEVLGWLSSRILDENVLMVQQKRVTRILTWHFLLTLCWHYAAEASKKTTTQWACQICPGVHIWAFSLLKFTSNNTITSNKVLSAVQWQGHKEELSLRWMSGCPADNGGGGRSAESAFGKRKLNDLQVNVGAF